MPRVRFRDFSKGLWVTGPAEANPPGTYRRGKNVGKITTASMRSRFGSTAKFVASVKPHSIVVYNDQIFYGAGTQFFTQGNVFVRSGLSGSTLRFVRAKSVAGQGPDYLFVVGGGDNFRVNPEGQASKWGIDPPVPQGSSGRENFVTGINFRRWERFDSTSGATAGGSLSFVFDPTIKPPDGSSGSVKLTVPAKASGSYSRFIPRDGLGQPAVLDNFRHFGISGAGPASSQQDWIVLDVRVDEVDNLEKIVIKFDTTFEPAGSSGELDIAYTREIRVDSETVQTLLNRPRGVADIPEVGGKGASPRFFASEPSSQFDRTSSERLGVTKLASANNIWTRLRIPKSSFALEGAILNIDDEWRTIASFNLEVHATDRGPVNVWIDNGSIFGGVGMIGDYKHLITYRDTLTGHRSDPIQTPSGGGAGGNPGGSGGGADTGAELKPIETKSAYRTGIRLTGILLPPTIPGRQLVREMWRTMGDDTVYFKVGDLPVTGTTFVDEVADFRGLHDIDVADSGIGYTGFWHLRGTLDTTQVLTFDNAPPPNTVRAAFGPHLGRMFWCGDIVPGHEGRIYESPIGRYESVSEFADVGDQTDPTVVGLIWGGSPYVFTKAKLYEGVGSADSPFIWREVFGVPGTNYPDTVVSTPFGIVYRASDGVRVFDGSSSRLVAPDAVEILFRGKAVSENIGTAGGFNGTLGLYHEDEYYLSTRDSVREDTLVVNLRTGTWRHIGKRFEAFAIDPMDNNLYVVHGSTVFLWDVPSTSLDAGTVIAIDWRTPNLLIDASIPEFIVQRVYIDITVPAGGVIAPIILLGANGSKGLPSITGPGRKLVEYALGVPASSVGLTLFGSTPGLLEFFGVEFDVHVPEAPGEAT
jgi:hypothetical protein